MKRTYIALLIFFMMLLGGCQMKQDAVGDETMLHVFADSTNWAMWQDAVSQVFGKITYTPRPEPEFKINYHSGKDLPLYKKRKNILILGYVGGEDAASVSLSKMVANELQQQVKEGKQFYFVKRNPWAKNQILLIGYGKDADDVYSQLIGYRKQLIGALRSHYYEHLQKSMFSRAEKTKLEQEIIKQHDFAIRVEVGYDLVMDDLKNNFFWLRRAKPDRSLFIHWEENKTADFVNADSILALRNKLTAEFYEGDFVLPQYTKSFPVTFAGHKALKIEGVWNNKKYAIGGPFKAYAFFDEQTSRVYMIDFYVFNPDSFKKPFLDQLEIIANSFKLKRDVKDLKHPWN